MAEALRLCPQAIVVSPRMEAYAAVSEKFRDVLDAFTPLVEPISIDEAFLDVTGTERLQGAGAGGRRGHSQARARRARADRVGGRRGGEVRGQDRERHRQARRHEGGPGDQDAGAFSSRCRSSGSSASGRRRRSCCAGSASRTLGQVARHPLAALAARLGATHAAELQALSRGEDARHVEPDCSAVSIGAEDTFEHDLGRRADSRRRITAQAERVAERLRRSGQLAGVVVLKLKDTRVSHHDAAAHAAGGDLRRPRDGARWRWSCSTRRSAARRACGCRASRRRRWPGRRAAAARARRAGAAHGERLGETLDQAFAIASARRGRPRRAAKDDE